MNALCMGCFFNFVLVFIFFSIFTHSRQITIKLVVIHIALQYYLFLKFSIRREKDAAADKIVYFPCPRAWKVIHREGEENNDIV